MTAAGCCDLRVSQTTDLQLAEAELTKFIHCRPEILPGGKGIGRAFWISDARSSASIGYITGALPDSPCIALNEDVSFSQEQSLWEIARKLQSL